MKKINTEVQYMINLYQFSFLKKPSPTRCHTGRGDFPSLDFVVSSVERWEGLREGVIFRILKLAFLILFC